MTTQNVFFYNNFLEMSGNAQTRGSAPGSRRGESAGRPGKEKNNPHLIPTAKTRADAPIRCLIDSYDDLLVPGHRWFAQNPLFASGAHSDDAARAERIQTFAKAERGRIPSGTFRTAKSQVALFTLVKGPRRLRRSVVCACGGGG